MDELTIYTDGACKGNPGPGGWGPYLIFGEHEKTLYGGAKETTNNRMELQAAIEALNALNRSCKVHLITDSVYMKDGITKWLPNWKKRQWKTASGSPVKNRDLWEALDTAVQRHTVHWGWVKGHAGDPGNEKADELANLGVLECLDKSS